MSLGINDIQSEIHDAKITLLSVLEDNGVDLLARALADVDRTWILVLYDPGPIAVARALAKGQAPSASLAAWKKLASILLTAYRRHSDRMVFASAAAVEAGPKQFQSSLSRHLKLSEAIGALRPQPIAPRLTSWQLVLASQAVAKDAEAALLDHELEAAALPLPPVSYDIDEAFTELEAAASTRASLLRQLANVRSELRESFLSVAAAEAGRANVVEKSDKPGQNEKEQPGNSPTQSDNPTDSAKNDSHPALMIGRIELNHYFYAEEGGYSHYDISIHDVQEHEMYWKQIRFKFCSAMGHEYLEFRNNPSLPKMFHLWPGQKEDQFGPYLNYPDLSTGETAEISDLRDRRLVRFLFKILERVVDDALSTEEVDEADKAAWIAKARQFATTQRDALASWGL